ncbi:MAG: hypothetical protein ACLR6I_10865 [Waltera sp.]
MNSKVEDGEDSDMEDMAYMEEKKWETGDSEESIRVQEISKTFHLSGKTTKNGAQCIEDRNSGGSSELLRKKGGSVRTFGT